MQKNIKSNNSMIKKYKNILLNCNSYKISNYSITTKPATSWIFLNSISSKIDYVNFLCGILYSLCTKSLWFINNLSMMNLQFFLRQNFLYSKLEELELKGINYRFSKFLNSLFLDLGFSHFKILSYPFLQFLLILKKKKNKKILFVNFNRGSFSQMVHFFRYTLKPVGPYKLKGFQFINEWIKLKEGKKPFK